MRGSCALVWVLRYRSATPHVKGKHSYRVFRIYSSYIEYCIYTSRYSAVTVLSTLDETSLPTHPCCLYGTPCDAMYEPCRYPYKISIDSTHAPSCVESVEELVDYYRVHTLHHKVYHINQHGFVNRAVLSNDERLSCVAILR